MISMCYFHIFSERLSGISAVPSDHLAPDSLTDLYDSGGSES
jgi:hypothetical protein